MDVTIATYRERNRMNAWQRQLEVFTGLPKDQNGYLVCRLTVDGAYTYWWLRTQEAIDREWEKI